jgi:hypothetical protein
MSYLLLARPAVLVLAGSFLFGPVVRATPTRHDPDHGIIDYTYLAPGGLVMGTLGNSHQTYSPSSEASPGFSEWGRQRSSAAHSDDDEVNDARLLPGAPGTNFAAGSSAGAPSIGNGSVLSSLILDVANDSGTFDGSRNGTNAGPASLSSSVAASAVPETSTTLPLIGLSVVSLLALSPRINFRCRSTAGSRVLRDGRGKF